MACLTISATLITSLGAGHPPPNLPRSPLTPRRYSVCHVDYLFHFSREGPPSSKPLGRKCIACVCPAHSHGWGERPGP